MPSALVFTWKSTKSITVNSWKVSSSKLISMPMQKEFDGVCFHLEGNSTFLMHFLDLQIRLGNEIGWSENLLTGDREESQCSRDESVTRTQDAAMRFA